MKFIIGYGFADIAKGVNHAGTIDLAGTHTDWFLRHTDEDGVALPGAPNLKEYLKGQILNGFISDVFEPARVMMAEALDWDDQFYIDSLEISNSEMFGSDVESELSFNLDVTSIKDAVALYEWMDESDRDSIVAWLAYHEEHGYYAEYKDFGKWVGKYYSGSYDSMEEFASSEDIWIPEGCRIVDDTEFAEGQGYDVIYYGSEILFYSF